MRLGRTAHCSAEDGSRRSSRLEGEAAMAPWVPALQINVIPWPADQFCFLRV